MQQLIPPNTFTPGARRAGVVGAFGTSLLTVMYAVTLAVGLSSLESPQQPIVDPLFSLLEILIMLLMPLTVMLFAAVHAWAPAEAKVLSLIALVFAGLLAGLTCSVHFTILAVGRHPAFAELAWTPLVLSFTWPSIAYALDILAWDVFFALAALFAAPVFSGSRLANTIRILLFACGALALAGLSGIPAGDMRLRNIGIAGYVGVFPIAALLLGVLFHRTTPFNRLQ